MQICLVFLFCVYTQCKYVQSVLICPFHTQMIKWILSGFELLENRNAFRNFILKRPARSESSVVHYVRSPRIHATICCKIWLIVSLSITIFHRKFKFTDCCLLPLETATVMRYSQVRSCLSWLLTCHSPKSKKKRSERRCQHVDKNTYFLCHSGVSVQLFPKKEKKCRTFC